MAGVLKTNGIPIGHYELLEEVYDEDFEPTQDDIIGQCHTLGIDPEKEPDFLHIAVEALKAPLPETWRPISDNQGGFFYHNFATGESTWEHPCDNFYRQLLQQEREKRRKAHPPQSTSHPGLYAGVPMTSLKNVPPLGPIGANKAPEFPTTMQSMSLKKPVLAPIGGSVDTGLKNTHDLPPIGNLPTLKPFISSQPVTSKSKKKPPSTTVNSKLSASAPPIVLTERQPAEGGRDQGRSYAKEAQSRPVAGNLRAPVLGGGVDLKVGPISTKFEEEDEDSDEDSEEEEESVEKDESFGKRFNVLGIEDLPSSSEQHKDTPELFNSDDLDNSNEDAVMLTKLGPSDESSLKPSTLPLTKLQVKLQQPSSAIKKPTPLINTEPINEEIPHVGTMSGSAMKLATAKERADLEKNHRDAMDKLREDHSIELNKLTKKFTEELEDKKEELKQEMEKKLTVFKEQLEIEHTQEKTRLHKLHEESLSVIKKTFKEEEEEEEAVFEEKKQDVIRNMKRKIGQEQEEEEKQLKLAKDDALKKLSVSLKEEQKIEEDRFREEHRKKMTMLKTELQEEKQKECTKIEEQNKKELDNIKEEMTEQLKKVRQELESGHQIALDQLKESLSKEHEEALETLRTSLQNEFESQRLQLEEQKALQVAVEEEATTSLEERRKQLLEEHEKEKGELQASLVHQLQQLKEQYEEDIKREKEKFKTELQEAQSSLASEKETKLAELHSQLETTKQELQIKQEQQMNELADLNSNFEREKQDLEQLKMEIEEEKQILQQQKIDLQQQQQQQQEVTIQSKEHDTKQSIRAELTQLRHKLQEEQRELDKLKIMKGVLTKDVEKLHSKKRSLLMEIENLSTTPKIDVVTTPKIDTKTTPTKTTATSKPDSFSSSPNTVSSALPITGPALVLSNPAVGSTQSDESTLICSSVENKQSLVEEPQEEEDHEQLLDLCQSDNSLSPSPPPSHKPHPSSLSYKARPSHTSHKQHSPPLLHNTYHVHKSTQSKKRVRVDNESLIKKPHVINKDKLLETLQSKLDEETLAIKQMDSRLSEGDKRVEELDRELKEAAIEIETEEFDDIPDRPVLDAQNTCHYQHTSQYIANLRRQLIQEGFIQENLGHRKGTKHHRSHAPRHRQERSPLRLEDLQESSGVSSTSELSSSSGTSLHESETRPHPQYRRFTPETERILRRGQNYPIQSTSSNQPLDTGISNTLEKINTKLEEVLERLDERKTPLLPLHEVPVQRQPDNHHWAEWVHSASPPAPSPPPTSQPTLLDVELHQRWQNYLNAAAKTSNSTFTPLLSPPHSVSKTDKIGRELIRKQKDWLHEFRQSLPKQFTTLH